MPQSNPARYRVFDAVVSSAIELPELRSSDATDDPEDVEFSLSLNPGTGTPGTFDWCHHWYQDEARQIIESSLAVGPEGYRLRFAGQADFLISRDGRHIVCEPFRDTPPETLRHLFLDHVLPRILGQRGNLVLHASAVELADGGGIAFVGKSGWGKSTLASSFRDAGARFLGDDCLCFKVVGGSLVGVPAYSGTRLWEDSKDALFPDGVDSDPVSHYNSKQRIRFAEDEAASPTEFLALFFLDDPARAGGAAARIRPMGGGRAIVELVKRSFLLDVNSVDSAAGQFAAVGRLLATRPLFYTLQYPRDFSRLAEVRQAILGTLGRG